VVFAVQTKRTGESIDGLLRNKIRVIQAVRGYRVSEDAIILTWFFRPGPEEFILDAGTGSGAIAFALAVRESTAKVVGLEIQAGLADRAARGAKLNQLDHRVWIVRGDLRRADRSFSQGVFDSVVSNPPYHEPGRGRINLEEEKALSRHQMMMPLEDLFRVASVLLKPGGRLVLIYPASGVDRIKKAVKETGFAASRMLWIHPHKGADPGLVCVEARHGADGLGVTEDSLFLYQCPGKRTQAAEAILAGDDIT
jgi:tRNA1Val (adenine37-N6)-methyltransferase